MELKQDSQRRPRRILPAAVGRALRKFGRDLRDARRRRRIPSAILAARASTSGVTLTKAERGDPGVSIAVYASILFALGMIDRLADLADARNDPIGLQLEEEQLPVRIRISRSRKHKAVEAE